MPSKTTKKSPFKEVLVATIDEYMDKAFAESDPEKRQKYREIIRLMEQLLLAVSELD